MKIEAGKRYVRRDGSVTGAMQNLKGRKYIFKCPNSYIVYTESGNCDRNTHPLDIVSEYIPDTPTSETEQK